MVYPHHFPDSNAIFGGIPNFQTNPHHPGKLFKKKRKPEIRNNKTILG